MMNRFVPLAAVVAVTLIAAVASAADPADKCQSGKLKESAKYASCRLKAESKAVLLGGAPDFSKCTLKFPSKFNDIEAAAGIGVCPSEGDGADIDTRITSDADDLAILLAGGTLPDCDADLVTCTGELATCDGDLSACGNDLAACVALPPAPPLKTSQTTCYNSAGSVVPCAGTGQDGEFQAGVARSFTDNGDGTVTDNTTGLMWEKLSNDGTIHDMDDTYTWANAFAAKIAGVNTMSFAGYNDWRLPNLFELETLRNLAVFNPATFAPFSTTCPATCTVLTCSCTTSSTYWSSDTYAGNLLVAWNVYLSEGSSYNGSLKTSSHYVRAVRAGL